VLDNASRQSRPDQAFLALPASHPHQGVGNRKRRRRATFQHVLPLDRSSMSRWRQRIGAERLKVLLAESLAAAQQDS
jgi:hypothetical protein